MGQIVRSNYYISIFNPDFHQPFPFNHGANQVKHSDQAATYERITTTRTHPGTRVAHPFIQICTPIYHGVSPCSNFAHQKLTISTTNISCTQEKSSHASSHLRIDTIRHQTEVFCMAQANRITRCEEKLSTLTAPTASRRRCPKWLRGTDTTLVQSPEHGRMGSEGRGSLGGGGRGGRPVSSRWGSRPCCTGCAHETASGPRSLAGQSYDHHDPIMKCYSSHGMSRQVITPPFARGL